MTPLHLNCKVTVPHIEHLPQSYTCKNSESTFAPAMIKDVSDAQISAFCSSAKADHFRKLRKWSDTLLSPYFFCNLSNQPNLLPLLFLCQFISDLTGCESTLGAQTQPVKRNIFRRLMNPADHLLFVFQHR